MMAYVKRSSSYHYPPHPASPYPWLVFLHGEKAINQTFYSLSEPQTCNVRSIPELRNKEEVWQLSHGWLLLCRGSIYRLWNPVTLESINLPLLEPQLNVDHAVLTSPPTNPDCAVVLFVPVPLSIIFCCIKDQTWIKKAYDEEMKVIGDSHYDHLCSPVVCKGRLYATTFSKGKLVHIKIVKRRWLIIKPLKCVRPIGQSVWTCLDLYLVESCGDLYVIDVKLDGLIRRRVAEIFVFKLDFTNKIWNKVESCSDRAFFISNGRAIACPAACSDGIGGQVHIVHYEDNRIFSYNIEDKSCLMSLPCPHVPSSENTPIWISPDIYAQSPHLNFEEQESKKEELQSRRIADCKLLKEQEEIVHASKNLLHDLPMDIVQEIISARLTPFDHINFRAVSRECRSVVPEKQWRIVSESVELERHVLSPWLIFRGQVKNALSLVDPRLGAKYKRHITIPQILEDAVICYSKNGWLLMSKMEKMMLYNPLTKSVICLPDLPPILDKFFLSSLPDSSDCLVVAIDIRQEVVLFTRPGMSEWYYMELNMGDDDVSFNPSHIYPVFLEGCLYFLGENGNLGVITLGASNCTLEVHRMKMPSSSFEEHFLVECSGEILSLFVSKAGECVQVFKLNQPEMVWEEVKSLGKNSLYVCSLTTIAAEAKCPEMENKIFFPRFHGESIICYSFETGRYQLLGSKESEDSLLNFYGSRAQLPCCWIEPRWNSKESKHSLSFGLDDLLED